MISLFIVQNPTLPTHHSNKYLAHAPPLPPGCRAPTSSRAPVRLDLPQVFSSARRLHREGRRIGGACAISPPSLRASVIARQEFSAASFFAWAPPLRALVLLLSPAAHRVCCCCMPLAATSLLPGHAPAATQPLPSVVQIGIASKLPDVSVSQAQRYRQRALLALRCGDVHAGFQSSQLMISRSTFVDGAEASGGGQDSGCASQNC